MSPSAWEWLGFFVQSFAVLLTAHAKRRPWPMEEPTLAERALQRTLAHPDATADAVVAAAERVATTRSFRL